MSNSFCVPNQIYAFTSLKSKRTKHDSPTLSARARTCAQAMRTTQASLRWYSWHVPRVGIPVPYPMDPAGFIFGSVWRHRARLQCRAAQPRIRFSHCVDSSSVRSTAVCRTSPRDD